MDVGNKSDHRSSCEKCMATEIAADALGERQGFPAKQGVLTHSGVSGVLVTDQGELGMGCAPLFRVYWG